jgi:hypothetical protein
MRLTLSVLCLLVGSAACVPDAKCGGPLYYDPSTRTCRPCPKDSTASNGTCTCQKMYEFVSDRCVPREGAVAETTDAAAETTDAAAETTDAAAETTDAAAETTDATAESDASSKAGCGDYCSFAKVCIGDNAVAAAALADVVSGLKANDPPACRMACDSDLAGDGSSDLVVQCISAGRAGAACAGDSTQTGLTGAITLVGDCCRSRSSARLCVSICKVLKANSLLTSRIDFCP